jgi:hypothetical protein
MWGSLSSLLSQPSRISGFPSRVAKYNSEIAHFALNVLYFNNSECLRLLQNQPGGLIMDDRLEARRAPKKTDHTMLEGMSAFSSAPLIATSGPCVLLEIKSELSA